MPKTSRKAPRTAERHTLSYQLREIIASRGLTAYAVGTLAHTDPGVVSRFLTGERDIRLETADRIAGALGLRLVEVGKARGRGDAGRKSLAGPTPVEAPDVSPIGDPDAPAVSADGPTVDGPELGSLSAHG